MRPPIRRGNSRAVPDCHCTRAEYLFKKATGGATLHQLRHSRLTHLGEDGWSAHMLIALSGHDNLLTLGIYVHSGAGAVAAALARRH